MTLPGLSKSDRFNARARDIAERQFGMPAYLIDDEAWAAAVAQAEATMPPEPELMIGLRLAVRLAKGGPLSTDGEAEREAFYAAVRARARPEPGRTDQTGEER